MLKTNDTETVKSLGAKPLLSLILWPNRSLDKKTFFTLMIMIIGAMAIPVIPFIGTKTLLIILAPVLVFGRLKALISIRPRRCAASGRSST